MYRFKGFYSNKKLAGISFLDTLSKQQGSHIRFYRNGFIKDSTQYLNGMVNGCSFFYDSINQNELLNKTCYEIVTDLEGNQKEWLKSIENYKNGLIDYNWEAYKIKFLSSNTVHLGDTLTFKITLDNLVYDKINIFVSEDYDEFFYDGEPDKQNFIVAKKNGESDIICQDIARKRGKYSIRYKVVNYNFNSPHNNESRKIYYVNIPINVI
ncbi:hypothetical protein [Flammeovirga aprica]|uniref:Uncharacterized protein n=1 Tax=Flammeovirga aprica JL-4 TaxID=694437 RepID=A0A7X9S1X6_9BACT|nr:hypothetical protein [Flammeovirga aprica]NME72863.1 hypothetical protein [Flammeovirga aprica JL-4]